jgi:hypothetical protein
MVMKENSTAAGDNIMSKEPSKKLGYAFNTFETANIASPQLICPVMSDGNHTSICMTDECPMWLFHMVDGEDTGKGHCGLVALPRLNYHEQII